MTAGNTIKALSGRVIRRALSSLPVSFYSDTYFSRGVSTTIATRNDPWFFESLLSVLGLSDEIIIIDSSEDPYLSYNKKIISYLNNQRINYIPRELNLIEARRLAKSLSTKEIIFHWDADMIALDRGIADLSSELNKYRNISRRTKFLVYFPIVSFFRDLDHVLSPPFHKEAWIFSNTKKELYKPRYENSRLGTVLEGFNAPIYFRKYEIGFPLAVHMSLIMPFEKLIQKQLQKLWMNSEYREKYGTFQRMREEIGKSIEINSQFKTVKFSESLQSPLPKLLERFKGMDSESIIRHRMGEIENSIIPEKLFKSAPSPLKYEKDN
jgi:hypothetical protein